MKMVKTFNKDISTTVCDASSRKRKKKKKKKKIYKAKSYAYHRGE